MFIELVDALRCVQPHEESWLVASAERMEARHIVEGVLGCPVCRASYPIHRGVADFRTAPHPPVAQVAPADAAPDDAERVAAFLGLTDASGFAVLTGAWCALAAELRALVETPLVLVDPAGGIEGEPGVSVLRTDGPLPLAVGAARGVATDDRSGGRLASAVRATRAGGRIIAPASVPLPAEVRELARDERVWVAEREPSASPPVTLHVRRGG